MKQLPKKKEHFGRKTSNSSSSCYTPTTTISQNIKIWNKRAGTFGVKDVQRKKKKEQIWREENWTKRLIRSFSFSSILFLFRVFFFSSFSSFIPWQKVSKRVSFFAYSLLQNDVKMSFIWCSYLYNIGLAELQYRKTT